MQVVWVPVARALVALVRAAPVQAVLARVAQVRVAREQEALELAAPVREDWSPQFRLIQRGL